MKVQIRPLKEQDAYTSVKWRNDPEVFKYTGTVYQHEITIESELQWIRKVIGNQHDYRCAILADDKYVGNIYLTEIFDGKAEYQIFIGDKEYWGKGVAKEASRLLIDYGFNKIHLNTIWLKVKKENVRAFCLYKALGFSVNAEDEIWFTMTIKNI